MSAKVSPEGKPGTPVNLYDDEDEERVPSVTVDGNGVALNTSAAAMRRYTYYTLYCLSIDISKDTCMIGFTVVKKYVFVVSQWKKGKRGLQTDKLNTT